MNLYDAIFERRSVRKYRMEPLDEKWLKDIEIFIQGLDPLFPNIKTKIQIVNQITEKHKISGVGNAKAPYYLVIYTEKKERSEMNAGYMMQQVVLYLTVKGLGSCYQGMLKNRDSALESEGLRCVAVLAFGFSRKARTTAKNESRRLSLEALCAYKEKPNKEIAALLESARLAPSAFNSQPWRFVVYENRFHIFVKKSAAERYLKMKQQELEFGIMLAHIMIAAEEIWIETDLIRLENISHKSLPNNQYVISVLTR